MREQTTPSSGLVILSFIISCFFCSGKYISLAINYIRTSVSQYQFFTCKMYIFLCSKQYWVNIQQRRCTHVGKWYKWSSLLERYNTGNFILMFYIQRNGTECPISDLITHINNTKLAGFLFDGVVLTVVFYVSFTYRQEHTIKYLLSMEITL